MHQQQPVHWCTPNPPCVPPLPCRCRRLTIYLPPPCPPAPTKPIHPPHSHADHPRHRRLRLLGADRHRTPGEGRCVVARSRCLVFCGGVSSSSPHPPHSLPPFQLLRFTRLTRLTPSTPGHRIGYTFLTHDMPTGTFKSARGFRVDLSTGDGLDAVFQALGEVHVVVNTAALSQPALAEQDYQYTRRWGWGVGVGVGGGGWGSGVWWDGMWDGLGVRWVLKWVGELCGVKKRVCDWRPAVCQSKKAVKLIERSSARTPTHSHPPPASTCQTHSSPRWCGRSARRMWRRCWCTSQVIRWVGAGG